MMMNQRWWSAAWMRIRGKFLHLIKPVSFEEANLAIRTPSSFFFSIFFFFLLFNKKPHTHATQPPLSVATGEACQTGQNWAMEAGMHWHGNGRSILSSRSVNVYVYIYIHICIYIYAACITHTHIYIYIYILTHVYSNTYAHTHTI